MTSTSDSLTSEAADASFITNSVKMRYALDEIELAINAADVPILITGETGTGKSAISSLAASKLVERHELANTVVRASCALMSNPMIEIFGSCGLDNEHPGLVGRAGNGVLILDDAHLLPGSCAGAVLSKLVSKDQAQGACTTFIVCMTRDTRSSSHTLPIELLGSFWSITIPSLRERHEDINDLFHLFWRKQQERYQLPLLDEASCELYSQHALSEEVKWPGNVRELKTSIRRLAACMAVSPPSSSLELVRQEIRRLESVWVIDETPQSSESPVRDAKDAIGIERWDQLDEIDQWTLARVHQICRQSPSVAHASRQLFSRSRARLKQPNDTHRLKSFLKPWGLDPRDWIQPK